MKTKHFLQFISLVSIAFLLSIPPVSAGAESSEEPGNTEVMGGGKSDGTSAPVPSEDSAGDDTGGETENREAPPADDEQPGKPAQSEPPRGIDMKYMLLVIGGVFLLMMLLSGRSRKKQQKKHQDMLDSLKKGDRIITIGGICGTVVEVKDKEIVARVSDNARIRLARWAIRASGEDAQEDKQKDTREDP